MFTAIISNAVSSLKCLPSAANVSKYYEAKLHLFEKKFGFKPCFTVSLFDIVSLKKKLIRLDDLFESHRFSILLF